MFVSFTDCPVCYNLIQANVGILRQKISELRLVLENIHNNPSVVDDADFRRKLEEVNHAVIRLWQDAKRYTGLLESFTCADHLIHYFVTFISNISSNTGCIKGQDHVKT